MKDHARWSYVVRLGPTFFAEGSTCLARQLLPNKYNLRCQDRTCTKSLDSGISSQTPLRKMRLGAACTNEAFKEANANPMAPSQVRQVLLSTLLLMSCVGRSILTSKLGILEIYTLNEE